MMDFTHFLNILCSRGGFTNVALASRILSKEESETRALLATMEHSGVIIRRFYAKGYVYQLTPKGAKSIGLNQPYASRSSATLVQSSRALARLWLTAECPGLISGEALQVQLGKMELDIPTNYKANDDLLLGNSKPQIMIYVPSGKGAERAIFEALTVFAASRLQVQIGFYTHIGSVDSVRNTISVLTGISPPNSANGPAKVVDRTDFAARMAAGSNTESGPWAGVFLPVKGFNIC